MLLSGTKEGLTFGHCRARSHFFKPASSHLALKCHKKLHFCNVPSIRNHGAGMNDLDIRTYAIESFSELSGQQEGEPDALGGSSFPELSECFPSSEKHYKFITHGNGNKLAVPFRRVTLTGMCCLLRCRLGSEDKDFEGWMTIKILLDMLFNLFCRRFGRF